MLILDIKQFLYFLDLLDPGGRHIIASEHPSANNGSPKWMGGATFEKDQRYLLITEITNRQKYKENIYYGVNRVCPVYKQTGYNGKANIDDVIAIRALAFDIDTLESSEIVLKAIEEKLDGELLPSVIISTGGGYHLIYILDELLNVKLYRPAETDEQKEINEIIIYNRSSVTQLARDFEHLLRSKFPDWKVDNMSNVDRVMRLPGTVNYPKAEKIAKGQKIALAHIVREYQNRTQIRSLRAQVPQQSVDPLSFQQRKPFVPSSKSEWTAYLKAKSCCEFIRDQGLADTNEWYTINVMLPLIGAIHDSNEHNKITIEEAEELFMLAVSGGARYGTIGRGPGYFKRQWKSHRPELPRNGTKSLGGLIFASKEAGHKLPWLNQVVWEADFQRQMEELTNNQEFIPDDIKKEFG